MTKLARVLLALLVTACVMQIDRPFLFAISDEPTGHILFLGRVLDPTQQ